MTGEEVVAFYLKRKVKLLNKGSAQKLCHYSDVTMGAMAASQITSITIVNLTFY